MTVSGKNKLSLGDVVVGDVWICSGQSIFAVSEKANSPVVRYDAGD